MRPLIDYTLGSQWNGGFVMEIFITNQGSQTIHDYWVKFDLPGDITDLWGGTIASHESDSYVVTDNDDKNDIAPGETVRFKLKVLSETGELPSGFTVNGEEAELTPEAEALWQANEPEDLLGDDYAFVDNAITVGPEITAAELEALLDAAPEGATVHLAAGEYLFDDAISITRSDVSLVGAGSGETRITFSNEALANNAAHGFLVEGTDTAFAGHLQADAAEGNDRLTLAEGHGLAVGDTVRIWQDNDTAFLDSIGDTSWRKMDAPLRTSMAKVVAVDGNGVTLDRGVHFDFAAGEAKIQRIDALENVTLASFSIGYQLGETDKGDFSNLLPELDSYHAVEFNGTVDSHLHDIQVHDGPSTAFEIALSLDVTADSLGAYGAFNKGSGGNGYAYELRESYDGDFSNLEDAGMRHSLTFASWRSSVGNDINIDFTDRDINFHGGRDHGNTIHVEQSIRDADVDFMSPTLWVNAGGESFGAPTDADANQVTFDYVVGSRRDDEIRGTDNGVYLDGALGHDRLYGGAGDDILRGGDGWGNDVIDGGDGVDTALFDQSFLAYAIRYNDDGSVFFDGIGDDDLLIDVEKAVFADGVTLDIATGIATWGDVPRIPTAEEILNDPQEIMDDSQTNETASSETIIVADPPTFTVALESVSRWSSGYVMAVEITNTSSVSIEQPEIGFDLAADIAQFYGATLLERDGDGYRIAYEGNDALEPGATLRFSFKAYAPESALPQALTINGHELSVDTSSLHAGSEPEVDALTSVTSNITSAWSSGHVAEVLVKNTSESTLNDVSISFDLPGEIDTLWNGTANYSDGRYTVSDDSAISLAPGEVWRFSYKMYHPEKALPTNTHVQGVVDESALAEPSDDALLGTEGDDELFGLSGDDTLDGGAGNDRLIGGLGADRLEGGAGADTFAFLSTFDSSPLATDAVLDFDRAEGDRIDLSAIDANIDVEGNQAFAWRSDQGFTGAGGEVRVSGSTLQGDVNGDGIVDLSIELVGIAALQSDDLIL